MSKSEKEVGITSPFGGSVASDEPELAIDEGVPESSVVHFRIAICPLFECGHPRRRGVREQSVGGNQSKR